MATSEPDGSGYFLYHSIGMFPGKAQHMAAALADAARLWGRPDDAQWPRSLEIRQHFLSRWRGLLGVPAGTLTTAENVTAALYSLMGSLPDERLDLALRTYVAEEESVSQRRREVQKVVDALNDEIGARYRAGSASVDTLLAAERGDDGPPSPA